MAPEETAAQGEQPAQPAFENIPQALYVLTMRDQDSLIFSVEGVLADADLAEEWLTRMRVSSREAYGSKRTYLVSKSRVARDFDDIETVKAENAVEQQAKAALEALRKLSPNVRKALVEYGLVLPEQSDGNN